MGRKGVAQIVGGMPMILSMSSVNRGPIVGNYRAPFLTPNREYGYPVIRGFYSPIADWVKCGENEAPLVAIKGRKEGRPCWRWVVRDFLKIFRKSRTNRWELTAPSSRPLIAANDSLFSGSFSARYRGGENAIKLTNSYSRLGAGRRVSQIGGGLPMILPTSSVNRGPIIGNYRAPPPDP